MQWWSMAAGLVACIGVLAVPAGAVEYRLQVANLESLTVAAYAGPPATPLPGTNTLARLETLLDQLALAPEALIPGREVHLLDHPGYGGKVPARLSVLPPTREHAWTTLWLLETMRAQTRITPFARLMAHPPAA